MPAQPQAGLSNEAVISAGTQRGESTAAGAMAEYKVRDDLLEGRVQLCLTAKPWFKMCGKRFLKAICVFCGGEALLQLPLDVSAGDAQYSGVAVFFSQFIYNHGVPSPFFGTDGFPPATSPARRG